MIIEDTNRSVEWATCLLESAASCFPNMPILVSLRNSFTTDLFRFLSHGHTIFLVFVYNLIMLFFFLKKNEKKDG